MVKRRSLADGLPTTPKADPEIEKAFVYEANKAKRESTKKPAKPEPHPTESVTSSAPVPELPRETRSEQVIGRSPLTTSLRSDIVTALKRASLERELNGQSPYMVRDILEITLEPWLKRHGYLK